MRRLRGPLLLSVVLLLLIELVARLAAPGPPLAGEAVYSPMEAVIEPDPRRGWRNRRGFAARLVGLTPELPVFEYTATVDGRGFRGTGPAEKPDPDVTRILLLGDSMVWGWGVDDEDTLGAQLGGALGTGYDVVSLGTPGYSTDQELLHLVDQGFALEPELVVLVFVLNDIEGNASGEQYGLEKPVMRRGAGGNWSFDNLPVARAWAGPEESSLGWLRSHSAFVRWVTDRSPEVVLLPEIDRERVLRAPWSVYSRQEVLWLCNELVQPDSVTRELLRRMASECSERGATLVGLALPHQHDQRLFVPGFPPPPDESGVAGEGRYQSRLSRAFGEVLAELGVPSLSLDAELLDATRAGQQLNVGDGHFNALGNAILGQALAEWIRSRY